MANRFVFVVNALSGPELRGGRCDADQIHSLLCSPNIGACRTKGTSLLQDCASRSVFNNALLRVLKEWKPQDQFIFYFTGHGEIKHGTYTLIFGEGGGRTNLPFSNIMADLQAHGVSRAIIVIDACHSGAALKRGEKRLPRLDPPEIRELPRGLVVLTSCRETESSYEKEDGSSSIFTHLFCKGIRSGLGGKATPDGFIGPDDIITYINEQLETEGFSSYPQSPAFCVDNANRQVWIAKNHTKIIQQDNEQKNEEQSTRSLEELKLLYEQTEASRRPCPGPSVDDLDLSVIKTYAEFINKADLLQKKSLNEIAQNLGLFSPITNNDLHQAAVLCFVKEPHLFIPQARALFTVGDKRSNDFRRVDVHGPLSTQVTQLFELTRREIMRSIGSYDLDAFEQLFFHVLRELISNAVVHRNYQLPQIVHIAIVQDSVEVFSPGALPGYRTFESFLHGEKVSLPNDAAITWYMSTLLAYEGVGRGFAVFEDYVNQTTPANFQWSGGAEEGYLRIILSHPTNITRTPSPSIHPDVNKATLTEQPIIPTGMTLSTPHLAAQSEIGGYKVIKTIGQGGMGSVYLAIDEKLQQNVVLKILSLRFESTELRDRFEQEARNVANMKHPNIVGIYKFGRHKDILYLAMEYVPKGDLSDLIRKGPVSPETAVEITSQIASALDYAHHHNLVHRDIKPGNVLISEDNRYLVTDFGIAKTLDNTKDKNSEKTIIGAAIGTMNYMSPEQRYGYNIDGRSDIFSLGVVMYELLTGKQPNFFDKKPPHELESNVPYHLSQICIKAIEEKPENRFQTAEEFLKALRNVDFKK